MVSITFTNSNGTVRTVEGEKGSPLMETAIGIATSVLSFAAANSKVRDLAGVLERLGAQGAELRAMLDDVEKRFGGFNAAMDEQISAFQGTLGAVAGHIESINVSASRTLDEANGIAVPTASHEMTAGHVDKLAQTQGDLDRRLGARQAAMETLLTTVAAKHEDFESSIRSFSSLIDDSIRKAEARARDIGTFLSDQTQSSTGLIDEQFAAVHDNAGKEREATAAALRPGYDQPAHEPEAASGRSVQRFRVAADEMRGLSQTIQEGLATPREEIRRGAVELPRETSEQAVATRRVVGAQVRALGELTDIVARSGRSREVSLQGASPPQPRVTRAPIPDPDVLVRQETTRREQERQKLEQQEQERLKAARQVAARNEAARHEARRDQARQERTRQEQARQEQPRFESTRRQGPPAAGERQVPRGQGLVSDLSTHASRDEQSLDPSPARTNGRSAEPLDAISTEIARMVDRNAAADAWERYRRGEDRAFDTSIYKGRGTDTFEKIRHRYKADDRFRVTVDRYVQEFERILSQIQTDDPEDRVLRDYLGSDSGKVYTMLAHAAGRIA